jgi:hypothetical protein
MSYTGRADENGICKCIDEQTRGHTVGGGAPGTAPAKPSETAKLCPPLDKYFAS